MLQGEGSPWEMVQDMRSPLVEEPLDPGVIKEVKVMEPIEVGEKTEVTMTPSLEQIMDHVVVIEKVLLTMPLIGIALANELRRAKLEPLQIKTQKFFGY